MKNKEKNENYFNSILYDSIETEKDINNKLKELISLLPNKGKLYKYRNIDEKKFSNNKDALKDGYIWMSNPKDFNDDFDSILHYDYLKEAKNIRNLFYGEPLYLLPFLLNNKNLSKEFKIQILNNKEEIKTLINSIDYKQGLIKNEYKEYLVKKYDITFKQVNQIIKNIKQFIKTNINDKEEDLNKYVDVFLKINQDFRNRIYVYSMAESYNLNPMWGMYCNSGNGFCIEYDYNKAFNLPIEKRKQLLSTFKVKYKTEPISFLPIIEDILRKNLKILDKEITIEKLIKNKIDIKTIYLQLLMKEKDWKYEHEWRLISFDNISNKTYIDLVSKIIIDNRILDSKEGQELIELSKNKNWKIVIRRLSKDNCEHIFEDYKID